MTTERYNQLQSAYDCNVLPDVCDHYELWREIQALREKVHNLEVDIIGHGYALDAVRLGIGLPTGERYDEVLTRYKELENLCKDLQRGERHLAARLLSESGVMNSHQDVPECPREAS